MSIIIGSFGSHRRREGDGGKKVARVFYLPGAAVQRRGSVQGWLGKSLPSSGGLRGCQRVAAGVGGGRLRGLERTGLCCPGCSLGCAQRETSCPPLVA